MLRAADWELTVQTSAAVKFKLMGLNFCRVAQSPVSPLAAKYIQHVILTVLIKTDARFLLRS